MSKGIHLALGVLAAACLAAAPVLAQGHGGGHGGGGGGHGGGGGGHMGGGGGHMGGGRVGGGGNVGGGSHFATGNHFAGGGRGYGGYGGGSAYAGHGAYGGGYRGGGSAYAGHGAYGGYHGGYGGYRGGYGGYHGGYGGAGYRGYHGYSTGAYWRGGYWRGGFWPRAYYGFGYAWFLPVLPLAYATYWYGGIPYYYANDVYYTWDPNYDGYVATDPPPVADPSGAAVAPDSGPPPAGAGVPGQGEPQTQVAPQAQGGQIFMYPKNGQSEEQQMTDKLECQKWASDQVGLGSNGPDYQRAMIACVEGRGYSAN